MPLHLLFADDVQIAEGRRPVTDLGQLSCELGGLGSVGVLHRRLVGRELDDVNVRTGIVPVSTLGGPGRNAGTTALGEKLVEGPIEPIDVSGLELD